MLKTCDCDLKALNWAMKTRNEFAKQYLREAFENSEAEKMLLKAGKFDFVR